MSTSKRSKAGSARAAYHHGDLRRTLVEAGLTLLEGTQQDDFSLRQLSRQVGVSANASYRHFADKESFLQALAAEGFRRLLTAQAKAAAAEKNPMERHRAAGKVYVRFARENPALFRLMFGRAASGRQSGELKSAGELAFAALRAGAAAALKLDMADERVDIAAVRAWSLAHGLSQLILAGHLDEFGTNLDAVIDAVLRPAEGGRATSKA